MKLQVGVVAYMGRVTLNDGQTNLHTYRQTDGETNGPAVRWRDT